MTSDRPPREFQCHDVAGRRRPLRVRRQGNDRVSIQPPPGEYFEMDTAEFNRLISAIRITPASS